MKTQEEKVSHTPSHTPGHWAIETDRNEDGSRLNVVTGDFIIASCDCGDNGVLDCDQAEANARLIASAPDLLDACKAIEPRLDRAGRGALACGPEGKDNDWETLKANL